MNVSRRSELENFRSFCADDVKCTFYLCFATVPDEFQYDPVSKSYGDVTRRPEVKSSTIEFIAPSEYMVN